MKSWYLLNSKPRCEGLARDNLERQGYEVYLPMTYALERNGQPSSRRAAMFPGYLFIRLSQDTDNWGPIRSTYGVSKLISFGQVPAVVPEKLVIELQAREDENGLLPVPSSTFERGQRVRIKDGPFQGYEAIFQSDVARDRVMLLLEALENSLTMTIEKSLIEESS